MTTTLLAGRRAERTAPTSPGGDASALAASRPPTSSWQIPDDVHPLAVRFWFHAKRIRQPLHGTEAPSDPLALQHLQGVDGAFVVVAIEERGLQVTEGWPVVARDDRDAVAPLVGESVDLDAAAH